jgi:hypothetical protein
MVVSPPTMAIDNEAQASALGRKGYGYLYSPYEQTIRSTLQAIQNTQITIYNHKVPSLA